MATVSERIYSELPNQPPEIVKAFQLDKAVPRDFCTKYLTENVKSKNVLKKNEHDLGYQHFVLDAFKTHKKLPRFNKKNKRLTPRERRKLQIHDIPKTGQKYSNFVKLHHLWLDYMKDTLHFDRDTFDAANKNSRDILLRADYHGCLVKVIQSKCPSYVGVSGIIIQDTRLTFKIINTGNVLKIIPKKSCTFSFTLGAYEIKIYGKNFGYKPMDRVSKKFRAGCKELDP